ncbi:hypothetical protein KAR91_73675 [Candidatus Pacearchaeota archaeon]|nr:hypothetical protein [Candidatus Pacearchaeota archaeon]
MKTYYTRKDLQERWEITAPTFSKMVKDGNVPKATTLNKAARYHIEDVLAFEEDLRN